MSKQNFIVDLELTTRHRFQDINANTPDEAISIAESLLEEGESGDLLDDYFIISADAYPSSEKEGE